MKKRIKKKYDGSAFFPSSSLDKETLDVLATAKIGDGGYDATGDVALGHKSQITNFTHQDKEEFLKRCGINPKSFLNE